MNLEPADKVTFTLPHVGDFIAYIRKVTKNRIHVKGCKLISPKESVKSNVNTYYKTNESHWFSQHEINNITILEKGPFCFESISDTHNTFI